MEEIIQNDAGEVSTGKRMQSLVNESKDLRLYYSNRKKALKSFQLGA